MGVRSASLTALAVGALALGSGCLSPGGTKTEAKKPDVMQPGVLPPPQETTRSGEPTARTATTGANGGVVQASATAPAATVAPTAPAAPAQPAGGGGLAAPIAKIASTFERKLVATDFAVGWQNRVAYLPDPSKNGRMSPGLAGQMFLFGGHKLEFVQADGVLTVDLVDDSPRPPGQPAAAPERWQFPKEILRNLQTRDETFGKSYVLFLPWPAYKPDITRVKISARYDPENGTTLFATPSTITLDTTPFGADVWKQVQRGDTAAPLGTPRTFGSPPAQAGTPIPLGGGAQQPMLPIHGPAQQPIPLGGGAAPIPIPNGQQPMLPIQNGPISIPGRSEGLGVPVGPAPVAPTGPAPVSAAPGAPPATPGDVSSLFITLPSKRQ